MKRRNLLGVQSQRVERKEWDQKSLCKTSVNLSNNKADKLAESMAPWRSARQVETKSHGTLLAKIGKKIGETAD